MEYDIFASRYRMSEAQGHQSASVGKYMPVSFDVRIIPELMLEECNPELCFGKQQADTFGFLRYSIDIVESTHTVELFEGIFVRGECIKEAGSRFELTVTPTEASVHGIVQFNARREKLFDIVAGLICPVFDESESCERY